MHNSVYIYYNALSCIIMLDRCRDLQLFFYRKKITMNVCVCV